MPNKNYNYSLLKSIKHLKIDFSRIGLFRKFCNSGFVRSLNDFKFRFTSVPKTKKNNQEKFPKLLSGAKDPAFLYNLKKYQETKLFKLFASHKNDLAWIFFASSVANLLMLTPMLYMLQIFDRIFISKSVITLLTVSSIILFFYVISALSSYIRSRAMVSIGGRIEKSVNEKLFYVSFKDRLTKKIKNPTSYLDDLTIVRQWVTGAAVFSVFDLPWVPLYVLIMFVMHPLLGYASLFLIIVMIVIGFYFSKVLGNQDEILREEEYETNDFLYGKLRNSEALSVYALAANFKETWKSNKRNFYVNFYKSQKVTDTIQNTMKQYRFFSSSIALTIGAFLVINDELTIGSMIAASLLMARTTSPVDSAVFTLSRVTIVREAFWRIEKMLNTTVEKNLNLADVNNSDNFSAGEKTIASVELQNVYVSYSKEGDGVIENLNLHLKAREITAVVGESGAGKTTLVKVLAGLVNYEGNIKYDGMELKDFSVVESQKFIGYLPQDVLMFPGSIAENISGSREPNSERIVEVAKLAGIHEFILKFPRGYDSFLEGGYQNISGGERQRIGLARAIYNNPAVLLLDEPNSALDHPGEIALKNVINYCKNEGKLVVVVTHRRSVLSYSDSILDLSDVTGSLLYKKEEYFKKFSSKEDFDQKFNF